MYLLCVRNVKYKQLSFIYSNVFILVNPLPQLISIEATKAEHEFMNIFYTVDYCAASDFLHGIATCFKAIVQM